MKKSDNLILVTALLAISLLLAYAPFSSEKPQPKEDLYVGVDVAYDNPEDIKSLIDEVSPYTNLFLIGSTGITRNNTKLNQIIQHLYDRNLTFIIYEEDPRFLNQLNRVKNKWGDKLLGLEYEDEMGGNQLDIGENRPVNEAEDWSDAANQFTRIINNYLTFQPIPFYPAPNDFRLFTADYALYWFDYKAGYDTVLAEFGWNYSRQINIALCRGAATAQNKEWGAIITWTYNQPPYIESGDELYQDLVLAYENGAKYILVFDTNKEYTEGILKQEHFDALKKFWQYKENNPRNINQNARRVAYVLPKDYAYGFRGPDDKIWGLWEADDFSLEMSKKVGLMLAQYRHTLDIIYDDRLILDGTYRKYFFWNGTVYVP